MNVTLPVSGLEADVRGMTGREEDLLANPRKLKTGEAVAEILANCTERLGEEEKVGVKQIDTLFTPDRTTLMLAIRRETYGDAMSLELKCGQCGKSFGADVDLASVESKPVDPAYRPGEGFHVKLANGVGVVFDFLTGPQERKLAAASAGDDTITRFMELQLRHVEGVHPNGVRQWLQGLPVKVRRELRKHMEVLSCGPVTDRTVDCPNCGEEQTFDVMAQQDFFVPAQ